MASVKVAVRVRPFNKRETDMDAKLIIKMEEKKTRIFNNKVSHSKEVCLGREHYKDFTFDYSYWSHDASDPLYASQEKVFEDLGTDVVNSAFQGYNACVFAYGQTGSGKTYTMMGSTDCQGLIPRICKAMFTRMAAGKEQDVSYRTEVSYLEIYNERVKDLLQPGSGSNHSLRVREHPVQGPYVQDLSYHLVTDYEHIHEVMLRGNMQRTTASTGMNDVSSRSHAIFTITFVQAVFNRDMMPIETVSKIHLVDLAGSERADTSGATGQRLKEGGHINKSLVTLGSVISALAELAVSSFNRRSVFIPYRDSVLTWLLKDSLGGNSKTIMIAAISPADCNYGETLSTLRYANRAKNIINKPTINEDPNVKVIRELREEISKLKALLGDEFTHVLQQRLHEKQEEEKVLTEQWTEKWRETQKILQEQTALGLRKAGAGVVLDSDMPHLVGMVDDDLLSTGVTLYHLKDGETRIGTDTALEPQDIILNGTEVESQHCRVILSNGVAILHPNPNALCWVNGVQIDKPTKLSQGCIIVLGTNVFRYNDPIEAAKMRKEGSRSQLNLSHLSLLSWSTPDLALSSENISSFIECPDPEELTSTEIDTSVLENENEPNKDTQNLHDEWDQHFTEPIQTLKYLCESVAQQKRLIIHSLESDCDKAELDAQIVVLQDLQHQYMSLEMYLDQHPHYFLHAENKGNNNDCDDVSACANDSLMQILCDAKTFQLNNDKNNMRGQFSPVSELLSYTLQPSRDTCYINCDSQSQNFVSVPSYILRGTGGQAHYEYEVRVCCSNGENWCLHRRYKRFRELHTNMRLRYGSQVEGIPFPPRVFFSRNSESLAQQRRQDLEIYLHQLLDICSNIPSCPLYNCRGSLNKFALFEFSAFFRKGLFETGKYSTS